MPRATNDARLAERAFRKQWPLKKATRKKIIDTLVASLDDEHAKTRIAAARALIAANGQNIEQERIDAGIDQPNINVFIGKLDVLSNDPKVIELNEEIISRLVGPENDGAGKPVGPGQTDQPEIPDADARQTAIGRVGQGSDDVGLDNGDHIPPAAREE